MQDSRASGRTGAMELLAAKFAEILAPALDPRGPYVKVMIAKLAETAIAALSPPAIGDGEIITVITSAFDKRLGEAGPTPSILTRNGRTELAMIAASAIAERAGAK